MDQTVTNDSVVFDSPCIILTLVVRSGLHLSAEFLEVNVSASTLAWRS